MKLSPEQKTAVTAWIKNGASIADVQKRLREEFQVSLTYIDTRFLIDDLGLEIQTPAPKPATPPPLASPVGPQPTPPVAGGAELVEDEDPYADEAEAFPDETPAAGPGGGNVTVDVDRVMRPGTVVSGSVTFSDGNTGKWALDQYGRLMFEGATPGYRPSPADLQTFQRELSTQLQRHGF